MDNTIQKNDESGLFSKQIDQNNESIKQLDPLNESDQTKWNKDQNSQIEQNLNNSEIEDEEENDEIELQQGNNDGQSQKLSKNAQKKQKRAQMWESIKQKKKDQKKQEKEQKKLDKQQQIIENQHNQQEQPQKQKQQHNEPYKSNQQLRDEYSAKAKNGQPIILDMQFLDKLESKEFKSLVKQLCYMQSSNKRAQNPVRFIITSVTPKLRQALYANHADKWGIEILDTHYLDLFPKENLVYLTGDTDQDLDELDIQKAFIIGGLVDHNRLKNVTVNAATEQGLQVKRFPIQNYLKLEASSILACNHVFDIMVKRANGESWKDSLMNSIPIRKVVATIENGIEVPTEHYLKKLEQMKQKQAEALLKQKLNEDGQILVSESNKDINETKIKKSEDNNQSDSDIDNEDFEQEQ